MDHFRLSGPRSLAKKVTSEEGDTHWQATLNGVKKTSFFPTMNQLLISLTDTSDSLSDAAFKIFRVPQNSIQSSYIQRQGPRGKKAQAPGCFQVGQWQTFLCKPVSVFNWNAIKLSILKLFSMTSVAEIHSSLIYITPWGCGVGITQVPAKLLIQPETGLLQFNSKEMSKTVVSVLALPQGELGWMWTEAHDKGELSSIKKLSCSYLYEQSMSCFQETRMPTSHIPHPDKANSSRTATWEA